MNQIHNNQIFNKWINKTLFFRMINLILFEQDNNSHTNLKSKRKYPNKNSIRINDFFSWWEIINIFTGYLYKKFNIIFYFWILKNYKNKYHFFSRALLTIKTSYNVECNNKIWSLWDESTTINASKKLIYLTTIFLMLLRFSIVLY